MLTARRFLAAAGSLVLLSLGVVGVAPAHAGHVTCGSTIMVSTVLDSNVGPCAQGISISADNITLNLRGFTISGNPAPGENAGINVNGRTGVTVKNGIVTQFDAGVSIDGGSANTVLNMKLIDNRGTGAVFGDGIAVFDSHRNQLLKNEVLRNGPYSGIGLIASDFNVIDGNRISDNNMSSSNTAGIRLENIGRTAASDDNIVTNNTVTNSGIFGIEVFAGGSRNQIKFNQVFNNALDGIVVFAGSNNNVIEGNNVRANRANGIAIRNAAGVFPAPAGNQILRNFSFGNAVTDLRDFQNNCGTNQWHGNQGGTGTPPCVFNP
jgi:parallel beta-helix repeat protein